MLDIVVGFITGILSSMGFGGGTLLLIYLTVFQGINHIRAAGINLIYFIPCALISVILYLKNKTIAGKDVFIISSGAIIGAIAGAIASNYIDPTILKKIFSVFVFFIGAYQLFKR